MSKYIKVLNNIKTIIQTNSKIILVTAYLAQALSLISHMHAL